MAGGVVNTATANATTFNNAFAFKEESWSTKESLAITNSQTNATITGMTADADDETSVIYLVEITRGTAAKALQYVYLMYLDTTWYLNTSTAVEATGTANGITFSILQTGNAVQVRYTSDTAGNGYIRFKKVKFNV